jgi:phage gp36-like protein
MAYASPFDLASVGFTPAARGQLTDNQIASALENASAFADSFLGQRYGTPPPGGVVFVTWDAQLTQAVAQIAALRLVRMRGYDPDSDSSFQNGYNEAVAYLNAVQRQQANVNGTLAASNLPGAQQPMVSTYSVVNLASGGIARQRGW